MYDKTSRLNNEVISMEAYLLKRKQHKETREKQSDLMKEKSSIYERIELYL